MCIYVCNTSQLYMYLWFGGLRGQYLHVHCTYVYMQTVVGTIPFSAHNKRLSLKCIHLSVDKQNNFTLSLKLHLPANTDAKGPTNEVGVGHLATKIHTHTHCTGYIHVFGARHEHAVSY